MLILVPSGHGRRVLVRGTRAKTLTCEVCDREFTYQLARDAVGADKSLFSWTDADSVRKAHADAEKNLDRVLANDHDAAPCRHCGWVQAAMIDNVRRRSYRGMYGMAKGFFLMSGAAAILFAGYAVVLAGRGELAAAGTGPFVVWLGIITALAAPGVVLWGLRTALNQSYSPNQGFHSEAHTRPTR